MFHLRFGLSDHLKALLDFVFGSRRRVKKVRIFRAWFSQECQQPYSPVASWMEDTDVALNDEGQQYGNLDEVSAIARAPRKCLVIWCGDHKQTPGGLRILEVSRGVLGASSVSWVYLWGILGHFGWILGYLGSIFGGSWGDLGGILGHFGGILGDLK